MEKKYWLGVTISIKIKISETHLNYPICPYSHFIVLYL